MSGFKKTFGLNVLVVVLFIADRLLKKFFYENPNFVWDFLFAKKLLSFNYAQNYGIAFSFFNHLESNLWARLILILITFVCIVFLVNFLISYYWRQKFLYIAGLSLIIAGAFSNLLDRVHYGFVVDYIDVSFFTIFNLADAMITGGIILILFKELITKKVVTNI